MDMAERESARVTPLLAGRTRWRSLVAEWVAAPPQSEWARVLNDDRIVNQDRIRPFVTRGVLLTVVAVCLVVADGFRPIYALLLLGVMQTVLEVRYEPTVRARHERLALGIEGSDLIVRAWYANYGVSITNVTGVIGLVACPVIMAVVIWGSGPADDRVAFKVVALLCATAYTASGALGPLTDAAAYDPGARMPLAGWIALRSAWVAVAGLIVGMVIWSESVRDAWGDALPYACLTAVVAYYPMLRVREYERAMAAAWNTAEVFERSATRRVALDLHSLLQPVKSTLLQARGVLEDPTARRDVTEYIADISAVYETARTGRGTLRDGFMPPLEQRLSRIADVAAVELEADLRLDSTVQDRDYRLARQLMATCVENSVQAYVVDIFGGGRRWVGVSAQRSGSDLVLEVSDLLDPVADAVLLDDRGTLGSLRAEVLGLGGTFEQVVDEHGKTLRIRWPAIQPLRTRADRKEGPKP